MAEVVGLASSVVAIIEIADRVIEVCVKYTKAVKNARSVIFNIIGSLKTILQIIETDQPTEAPLSANAKYILDAQILYH
jgi:hypothetical protein